MGPVFVREHAPGELLEGASIRSEPSIQPPESPAEAVLDESPRGEDGIDDETLRAHVKRLARPHRSGGWVVERAAVLAGGPESGAAVAWIEAHGGIPELPVVRGGLHGPREAEGAVPLRFVLPRDALG